MWFIYLLSWLALLVQLLFLMISLAAGLYYLAELVEEYSELAKRIIFWMTFAVLSVYILLGVFEEVYTSMIVCGVASQLMHFLILQTFPVVSFLSFPFISGIILFFVNHYLTFGYFTNNYFSFAEVLGFFTICLWLVPFSLFISLSANDNVLPVFSEQSGPLLGDGNDALGSYLSKKKKKYGLLPLFHYLRDVLIPQNKKMF